MLEHLHMAMTVDKFALLVIFFNGSFFLNCCHVEKNDPSCVGDVTTACEQCIFISVQCLDSVRIQILVLSD